MTLEISVYSDVVCPWCYIGKHRLEKALQVTGLKDAARVRWLPFELNPGLPPEGVDRRAYMTAKFGPGHERAEERVSTIGQFENIPFNFSRITRVPNTFKAHRLIRWAEKEGRQDEIAEALFQAYFVEGRHIGDPAALAETAAERGFNRIQVERFLAGDELAAEVRAEEERSASAGIHFVPYFIVNGELTIRGAESVDVMAGILREAAGPVSTQNTL